MKVWVVQKLRTASFLTITAIHDSVNHMTLNYIFKCCYVKMVRNMQCSDMTEGDKKSYTINNNKIHANL